MRVAKASTSSGVVAVSEGMGAWARHEGVVDTDDEVESWASLDLAVLIGGDEEIWGTFYQLNAAGRRLRAALVNTSCALALALRHVDPGVQAARTSQRAQRSCWLSKRNCRDVQLELGQSHYEPVKWRRCGRGLVRRQVLGWLIRTIV